MENLLNRAPDRHRAERRMALICAVLLGMIWLGVVVHARAGRTDSPTVSTHPPPR